MHILHPKLSKQDLILKSSDVLGRGDILVENSKEIKIALF